VHKICSLINGWCSGEVMLEKGRAPEGEGGGRTHLRVPYLGKIATPCRGGKGHGKFPPLRRK